MDPLQLHLLANHLPVVGVLFAAVTLVVGLVSRSEGIRRFGLACLVGVALVAVPVYFSGEPAEERLEKAVALSENLVERHDDAARAALIVLAAAGALAIVVQLRSRRRLLSEAEIALLLVAAIGGAGTIAWAAHLGGQIRHSEIRAASTADAVPGSPQHAPAGTAEGSDDD